jgi:polyribonucleotide nucleotidyltransferase
MLPAIEMPRSEISPYAPKISIVRINPDQIAEVIGSRGKVIKRIIEESGVEKIDTEDDGRVFVADKDMDKVNRAVEIIKAIVNPPEVGAIYTGKVTRLMSFGAFVELAPEKEGLVHISQWGVTRVESMEAVTKEGDVVQVKVTEIDDQGRINLSRKAVIDPTADTTVRRPPPRSGDRGRGGDRGGRSSGSGGDRRPPRGKKPLQRGTAQGLERRIPKHQIL